MFGWKKKDPICGMKQNNRGIEKHGHWFCSKKCVNEYEKMQKSRGCCH